jgi:hypothetical protein
MHSISKDHFVLTELLFLFLGLVSILLGCDTVKTTKEGQDMGMTESVPVQYLARPPVDVSAPAAVKTATFALG